MRPLITTEIDTQQLKLLADIYREIYELPLDVLGEVDLPQAKVGLRRKSIRLFPLGEFCPVNIGGTLAGRSVLYLTTDGDLYEYGPERHRAGANCVGDNVIALRPVQLEDCNPSTLLDCRDLIRRLSLI